MAQSQGNSSSVSFLWALCAHIMCLEPPVQRGLSSAYPYFLKFSPPSHFLVDPRSEFSQATRDSLQCLYVPLHFPPDFSGSCSLLSYSTWRMSSLKSKELFHDSICQLKWTLCSSGWVGEMDSASWHMDAELRETSLIYALIGWVFPETKASPVLVCADLLYMDDAYNALPRLLSRVGWHLCHC